MLTQKTSKSANALADYPDGMMRNISVREQKIDEARGLTDHLFLIFISSLRAIAAQG